MMTYCTFANTFWCVLGLFEITLRIRSVDKNQKFRFTKKIWDTLKRYRVFEIDCFKKLLKFVSQYSRFTDPRNINHFDVGVALHMRERDRQTEKQGQRDRQKTERSDRDRQMQRQYYKDRQTVCVCERESE